MLNRTPSARLCASLVGWVVRSPAIMCSRIGPGGTERRPTGSNQDDGIGVMSVPPGVSTAFPSQRLAYSGRSVEAMRWNWAVERLTYRRGWPVGVGVLSGSTTQRCNWLPRQDSKTSSICASRWSTATPSGCRAVAVRRREFRLRDLRIRRRHLVRPQPLAARSSTGSTARWPPGVPR